MNFRRGRQMIVHDPGLMASARPNATPPLPAVQLTPPVAWRRWTVHPQNSVGFILGRVNEVIDGAGGAIDALHFMGHGSPGGMALGRGRLDADDVPQFEPLRDKVRVIVFFSCQVGGEHQSGGWSRTQPTTIGRRISDATGATVVVAQQNQTYSYNRRVRLINFGPWEGPVDVYAPGTAATYNAHNPFRREPQIDLERLIFGSR